MQKIFLYDSVILKSNVNLHLEEGAYLKFSSEKYLYTPTVLPRWEGVDCYNLHPLIYAYGESNIAITCLLYTSTLSINSLTSLRGVLMLPPMKYVTCKVETYSNTVFGCCSCRSR